MNKCGDVLTPREVCCESYKPLYEVFCSSRDILGQHSPRAAAARRPSSPCHRLSPGTPASRLPCHGARRGSHQAPRAGGQCSAPKSSMGRGGGPCPMATGALQRRIRRLEHPHAHEPSGPGTGACLALAEGLQVGRIAPEKPSYGTTEGEGQPVPESWPRRPGGRHRTLANAFHAARLGKSRGAAAESPPAPAGNSASPAAAGSFLLISSQPAAGCGPRQR